MVARSTVGRDKRDDVGLPGDKYRVELRGATYWVTSADTSAVMGQPWRMRDGGDRAKRRSGPTC